MKRRKGIGLGLLPPQLRWVIVFGCGLFFIFINDLEGAIILLLVGLLLFLANPEHRWRLALSAPVSGGLMFVYNAILSPPGYGGIHFFFLTINPVGIERGLVTGLRLTGVMLISYAWLFSTTIPEIYEGIAFLRFLRPWILGILRGMQILKRDFVALVQSLLIRGVRWDSIWASVKNLVPLAMAVIPRILINSQKATFALQSHHRIDPQGEGEIVVTNVNVRYSSRLPDVLREINLVADPGSFIYLAGKSGAGKTTLLRVMGGFIPWIMGEFRGQVEVSGLVTYATPLPKLCGTVRYVAPDPFCSIYGLTVGQEISLIAKGEWEARAALNVMGIEHLWNQETTKLSGGQQVRLVLAGVLASKARVLLLDAPMQELDPMGRKAFIEALTILREKRFCTVVATDPFWQELQGYTNRVVVLEEGRVTRSLTPVEFFTDRWLKRCNLFRNPGELQWITPGDVIARMCGVRVVLEGNPILKGIDFSLREGELVAVTGSNGSGKTTAMLTLAGAIRPLGGEVKTSGRVGYCFQDPGLQMVQMTVEDELAFGPKILAWPRKNIETFVRAGLVWTGLEASACPLDLHPSPLRMLSIASSNTGIATLILDEPTVGLDSEGVTQVLELIQQLLGQGKGVVMITHDEQLAALANRVVVIEDGRVQEERTNF